LRIVAGFGFGFGRRNVSDPLHQSSMIEPVDPFQRGELDGFDVAPRPAPPNDLGFIEPVDRLGERIVVAVADAAVRQRTCPLPLRHGRSQPATTANRIRAGMDRDPVFRMIAAR